MTESYGSILPKHAIYPSSGFSPYLMLLIASKFLRAVGLFLSYDLLKLIPVIQFLFIVKAGSSVPLLFLQKPFSSGKRITKNQWFRVLRHAFFGGLINVLWLFGLTLCGPLRTILLFEHSDLVIIAGACALFTNNGGGPSKLRGAIFFLIAVIVLLLFDHDEKLDHLSDHESDKHQTVFTHLFYHIVNFIGWSDHKWKTRLLTKLHGLNSFLEHNSHDSHVIRVQTTIEDNTVGGVVLLAITLCIHVGYSSASKKLCVDIGGSKRLHALSTFLQTLLLFPWTMFMFFTRESYIESWLYLLFPLALVVLFVFVVDFYIEAVVTNHLQPPKTAVYGTYAIFISALFLGLTWNHPMMAKITTMHKLKEIITEDHVLSGGVVFSLMTFLLSTSILAWPGKGGKGGSFVGYSPAGLPLYSFTGEALHKTSHSLVSILKNGLRQIYEDANSRKIFYFLCINLIFTFVELVYGVWTNSLGLISDGFHMLFDCSALVMGLYAAVMSRWKATRIFSFGYDRVEILSGFINGLFLVVIGIFVFIEAIERLFDPPDVKTERLLAVSVLGLLVNLVGITAFRSSHTHSHGGGGHHGHSHGGGHGHGGGSHHGHSHGGGSHHGHSHGGGSHHGHSHGGGSHSTGGHHHSDSSQSEQNHHNVNMEGVFLHVLADTMGSVGVIISSLLIENFGWNIADPICSLFIATMILLSVFPLLKETSTILLIRTPVNVEKELPQIQEKLLSLEGVLSYREPHIWSHTGDKVWGSIHIQVSPDASEQKIIAQVTSVFKEIGVTNVTVQVEKESYFLHMSGLGANQILEMTNSYNVPMVSPDNNFIKAI